MPQIHNVNIQRIQPLPSPKDYLEKLPITPRIAQLVGEGREQIARILRGEDDRILVIVGPCSLHDVNAGFEYAKRLKELADPLQDRLLVVMRVYFEKPRTTVGWKGLIYDPYLNGSFDITTGLQMARKFLLRVGELGVLAATEFVDPITPQYIADLVSWAAIGARTAESQTHRQMSSGLSMPVGFKNGTGGSIQLAVDGVVAAEAAQAFLGVDDNGKASVVVTKGNPNCHIVLRGGSRGPNYDSASIADAVERLQRAGVSTRLVVDCSHANCSRDHTKERIAFHDVLNQRVSGNQNIVGVMLESHLHEGSQKLDEKNPSTLKYGVSITDPCIGWGETVELVTAAHQSLSTQNALRARA
ncbi:MAG: 3-deoxy-7-phosphoheptulonate synthase [Chloroflexi bacterium]|nr:3-deoxy-7-phosphoheptulonate synthase [Chloroflexota bacterium]